MTVWLAALASGLMFYLSQGLDDVWALAFVAPAPLLWLAYGRAARWKVVLASVAAFAAGQIYLVQCYWGRIPASILAPLVVAICASFSIVVLLSAEVFRRGSPWGALVAFPASWAALEYGIDLGSPHGSYGALGYAEVSFPAAIQLAALFGVSVVSFLLCLSANSVALLLRHRWAAGSVGLAVCVMALVFGFARLVTDAGPRVRVAALSAADNRSISGRYDTLDVEKAAAEKYAAHIGQVAGVRVVAIPEGALHIRANEEQAVLAPLATAAKARDALVLAGTYTPEPEQNRAFAFLPGGGIKTYEKRHPLLPFETEAPGRDPGWLGSGYATQICKDMDFPATVRGTAGLGVRLMIVPANDFGRDGWMHARMAIMRGVENGFAVLRSAFNGLETISDAQGRILAKASTERAGMVAVSADVPLGPGPTLYTRMGDVFPWVCAALSLLLLARLLFLSKVSGAAESKLARNA